MSENRLTLDLGPELGSLPAKYSPKVIYDLEAALGALSGVARRVAHAECGWIECGTIIHRLLKEGDPETCPTRGEVDAAMLQMGLADAMLLIQPFLERVIGGARVDEEAEPAPDSEG